MQHKHAWKLLLLFDYLAKIAKILLHLQGHVVSYDSTFSPANPSSVPIPELRIDEMLYGWGGAEDNGDKFRNAYFRYSTSFMKRTIRPVFEAVPSATATFS